MKVLKSKRVFLTGIITISAFFSTGYVACTKDNSNNTPDPCTSVVCQNGGTCFKGVCSCPVGYEGARCETKALARLIGKWETKETVAGSNNNANIGDTISYVATVREGANAATFLINNFRGNSSYNDVSCRLGENRLGGKEQNNKFRFTPDQRISGTDIIIKFGEGQVNENGTVMTGYYVITYPDLGLNTFVTDSIGFQSFYQQ